MTLDWFPTLQDCFFPLTNWDNYFGPKHVLIREVPLYLVNKWTTAQTKTHKHTNTQTHKAGWVLSSFLAANPHGYIPWQLTLYMEHTLSQLGRRFHCYAHDIPQHKQRKLGGSKPPYNGHDFCSRHANKSQGNFISNSPHHGDTKMVILGCCYEQY